ncbi:hypothetical protein FDA94_28615 [Herbidospora galbida]|uniref:Uncharacterized protein n=1 Tax=Herbidospora galbida TaxID=2575442 RepID=A0A4U3M6P0_9ACTN|nr:hypothetical protein [Herbidospora galbida]TKK84595.1 hypothetical protein FDA94_28615 [Herbidospora galbida]
MGWNTGGQIFDIVAQALDDAFATEETVVAVLTPLVAYLQDEDWDTEDESLAAFRHNPAIVKVLVAAGVDIPCGDDNQGTKHVGITCDRKLGHQGDHMNIDTDDSWPQYVPKANTLLQEVFDKEIAQSLGVVRP